MNPEERDRLAERWMDAALRRTAQAEPRPGLEQRILAQLAAAENQPAQAPWWRFPMFRFALPVMAAALVLVLVLTLSRHATNAPAVNTAGTTAVQARPQSPPSTTVSANASPAATVRSSPQRTRRTQRKPQRGSMVVALSAPRLEQFPAPSPLSEQEQLLLRYLQRTPVTEIAAVIAENRRFEEERLRELENPAPRAPAH